MYFLRWLITAGINPVTLRRMKGFLSNFVKTPIAISAWSNRRRNKKNIFPPLSSTKTYYMSQS